MTGRQNHFSLMRGDYQNTGELQKYALVWQKPLVILLESTLFLLI